MRELNYAPAEMTPRPPSYSSGDYPLPKIRKPKPMPNPEPELLMEQQTSRQPLPPLNGQQFEPQLPPTSTMAAGSGAGGGGPFEQTQQQQPPRHEELLEGQQLYGQLPQWEPASTHRVPNGRATADWPDEWFESQKEPQRSQ